LGLTLQGFFPNTRVFSSRSLGVNLPFAIGTLGAASGFLFGLARWWRRQRNSGTPGSTQPHGNGLLRRASAVLSASYVVNFFMYKFARRSRRRLAFAKILLCSFHG
jgi:hypothetical protein